MNDTVRVRDAAGAEYASSLERVLEVLIATLANGRMDEAVALYAQIREDIGYQLIAKTQGNRPVLEQVANLFFQANDYHRAAYCCEQLDASQKAAELYELADDTAAASQMYARVGNFGKAAELSERAGSFAEAAAIHLHIGKPDNLVRAAMCFEKAGRPYEAATAWERAGRFENALGQYHVVADSSPDKKHAERQASALEERLGLRAPRIQPSMVRSTPSSSGAVATSPPPEVRAHDGESSASRSVSVASVTTMEGFEALRRIPLFSELSLPEQKSIHHLCVAVDVAAGAHLITAGQASPALWVLVSAVAEVRGGGTTVVHIEPGDHIGEMGLFDDSPAEVDVVVIRGGRCLRLEKTMFVDAMGASDAFALRIHRALFRTMRDRLRLTTRRLTGILV
jgi:tetratricopeptide (TPR) repeat protein